MSKPHDQSEPYIDHLIDVARGTIEDPQFEREHRNMKRRPYSHPAWLVIIHGENNISSPMRLRGRNISPGGLCALCPALIHPGSECALMMARSDHSPVVVGARAVYCNFIGPENYEVGLEFTDPPIAIGLDVFCDAKGQPLPLDLKAAA